MVNNIASTGLAGIQAGINTAGQAAQSIASASTRDAEASSKDITTAAVELKQAEQQVQASAKVVKSADEMLGTVIDTLA
jgi:flagellar basal body rod protein FlgG